MSLHSRESEYLHFTPSVELPPYEELVATSQIFSPQYLVQLLQEAREYLAETPGPNIAVRNTAVITWLDAWELYLLALPKTSSSTMYSPKLKPNLTSIKQEVSFLQMQHQLSGLLLMGGGEGTVAHRHAVNHVAMHVEVPIFLFEHPEYVTLKPRGGRFLPLSMGLSMWAHYHNTRFLGMVPRNTGNLSAKDFYQQVHDDSGAMYHFAYSEDPNRDEKIARGKIESFCIIPYLDSLSTTQSTQKLNPEIEVLAHMLFLEMTAQKLAV